MQPRAARSRTIAPRGRPPARLLAAQGAYYDYRRTQVRNLEKAGVSRSAAMAITGHKTEAVYRRYAIVDSVTLQDAGEKLNRLHAAGGGQS